MQLAFAATMIRPGRLHDSLIVWKLSASEFSHSLGQQRKSSVGLGMSAPGGRADVIRAKADIETAPESRADPSVNASLGSRYG